MKVWRKKTVRWERNGTRATKDTPGARKRTECSKRYYGTLRLSDGRTKQVALSEDRKASEKLLRRLQTEADTNHALGITPRDKERQRPLSEHIAEFESHLKAKGSSSLHVSHTMLRIRAIVKATKARTVADLDAVTISRTLATWREKGTPQASRGRKPAPISVGTSNHYTRAIKGFARWLWIEGRTTDDVLRSLKMLNGKADRRRNRRALDNQTISHLIETTRESGKTLRGSGWRLTAEDRAWLYTLAAYTGLRASELASLSVSSIDLEAGTVTVRAAYSKRRREDVVPLHASLIDPLRSWCKSKGAGLLWSGTWAVNRRGASILRQDLRRAEIPYRDEQGRYADFHSLRHSFVSSLARSGVHPSVAKELARHSTITLTMDAYTHQETETLRRALDLLPDVLRGSK